MPNYCEETNVRVKRVSLCTIITTMAGGFIGFIFSAAASCLEPAKVATAVKAVNDRLDGEAMSSMVASTVRSLATQLAELKCTDDQKAVGIGCGVIAGLVAGPLCWSIANSYQNGCHSSPNGIQPGGPSTELDAVARSSQNPQTSAVLPPSGDHYTALNDAPSVKQQAALSGSRVAPA